MGFFEAVIDFFKFFIDTVVNFFTTLSQAVVLMSSSISGVLLAVPFLPATIASSVTLTLTILVVRFLLMK